MADEEKAPVVQAEKPEKQKKQKKVAEGGIKEVCGMRAMLALKTARLA